MSEDEEPDLFPEVIRIKRRRVTHRDLFRDELKTIRQAFGVTTPEIARKIQVPSRTMEHWMRDSAMPPEWSCRLLLNELRKFFPR